MSVDARFRLPPMPMSCGTAAWRRAIRAAPILRSLRQRRMRLLQLTIAALWPLALLATILLLTGCTLGPTTEVRYVIVHPGQPVRILDRITASGERLDGGGVATLDLSGWVAMPPDHWEVIARRLAGGADPQRMNVSASGGTAESILHQTPTPPVAPRP